MKWWIGRRFAPVFSRAYADMARGNNLCRVSDRKGRGVGVRCWAHQSYCQRKHPSDKRRLLPTHTHIYNIIRDFPRSHFVNNVFLWKHSALRERRSSALCRQQGGRCLRGLTRASNPRGAVKFGEDVAYGASKAGERENVRASVSQRSAVSIRSRIS